MEVFCLLHACRCSSSGWLKLEGVAASLPSSSGSCRGGVIVLSLHSHPASLPVLSPVYHPIHPSFSPGLTVLFNNLPACIISPSLSLFLSIISLLVTCRAQTQSVTAYILSPLHHSSHAVSSLLLTLFHSSYHSKAFQRFSLGFLL